VQLSQINRIISLKQSGFTLKEIVSMSEDELSGEAMARMLEAKLAEAKKEQKYANAKVRNLEQRIEKLKTNKEKTMKTEKIKVPPFHNTLMGMIKAVSDYYGRDYSDAVLYGGSGQAFLINIHKELCPSGPYVWNYNPFFELLKNIGIDMTDHGMYTGENTKEEINKAEEMIKKLMDEGVPCGLANLENQIILGYDETGFDLSQPWGGDFPVGRVTYDTWDEFKEDKFACFYSFRAADSADKKRIFTDSLKYAVDFNDNHTKHSAEGYTAGIAAYDVLIEAVENGHGTGHGNWWNCMVYSECRQMASDYFIEMKDIKEGTGDLCAAISKDYRLAAEALYKAADKSIPIKPKIELIKEIKKTEEQALEKIKELLKVME
jgi:DNA-binding transcriptional MerR regulator